MSPQAQLPARVLVVILSSVSGLLPDSLDAELLLLKQPEDMKPK